MNTQIFTQSDLALAAALLQQGKLVAFPTETVYGLGAIVSSPAAIQRIFEVKGRPSDNPLIVHIAHLEEVSRLAREIPQEFYALAEVFFPGPLTIVLRKAEYVPSLISAGLDTIALRAPSHPLAQKLISLVGEPLAAPSANLSGRPSSTSCAHVLEDFNGKIAGVVDGGETAFGLESTVISLLDPTHPVLLRPGEIHLEAIEELLKRPVALATKATQAASPGMKYRHYAPKAKVTLVFSEEELEKTSANMVLARKSTEFPLSRKSLYALLRLADQRGEEEVVIFCDPVTQRDNALMNRLTKIS